MVCCVCLLCGVLCVSGELCVCLLCGVLCVSGVLCLMGCVCVQL